MPTKTINDLTNTANILDGDELAFWNLTNSRTDKITYAQFKTDLLATTSSDTEILFNNAGVLDGDSRLIYDPALNRMAVGTPLGVVTHTIQLPSNGSIGQFDSSNSFTQYSSTNVTHRAPDNHIFFTSAIERLRIADAAVTTTVNHILTPVAYVAASGNERSIDLTADITGQTGTATFAGFFVNILDTARSSSGVENAVQIQNDGSDILTVGGGSGAQNSRLETTGHIQAINASFFKLKNDLSSATNPVFIPNRGDNGTGWGGVLGQLDAITGGSSRMNITGTLITSSVDLNIIDTTDTTFSTSKLLTRDAGGVLNTIVASGGGTVNFLRADGTWAAVSVPGHTHATTDVISGTFVDARIAASNVTQHEAALTILETQITDGSILARVAGNETISGNWTFTNAVDITADGTAAIPAIRIGTEDDGFYRSGVNEISLSLNNTQRYIFAALNFTVSGNIILPNAGELTGSTVNTERYEFTVQGGGGGDTWMAAVTDTGGSPTVELSNPGAGTLAILSSSAITTSLLTMAGNLVMSAQNIVTDTTTGMQLWTAAAQKGAFWGLTPVVQPLHIIDADGTLADITTKFNTLLAQMATTGLQAAT